MMLIINNNDIMRYTLRQLYQAIEDVGKQIMLPEARNGIVPECQIKEFRII